MANPILPLSDEDRRRFLSLSEQSRFAPPVSQWPGLVLAPDSRPERGRSIREADAKQTRLESLTEAGINVVIGFVINFIGNLLILPLFGFNNLTIAANFGIGICFTVVSVARQYVIRRWAQDHLRRVKDAIVRRLKELLT